MLSSLNNPAISIVIPTYQRGSVLLDTIRYLLSLDEIADEIIVVDQTRTHGGDVHTQLSAWSRCGKINWVHKTTPSVVAAMNLGLSRASSGHVLFLDDDVRPERNLISSYKRLIRQGAHKVVAGRVVQPWDHPQGVRRAPGDPFSFNSTSSAHTEEFIGANFLVDRNFAISVGGFDENFIGTAHNYEKEFADRCICAGENLFYFADAVVFHLKEPAGGIRSYGHFLKTARPHHAVGAYYYILRSARVQTKTKRILQRVVQRLATKTHLKEPWWIPLTFIGDLSGLMWAMMLVRSGPKLMRPDGGKIDSEAVK